MASPLNTMLYIILTETERLKTRCDEDMIDFNDIRKMEMLASIHAKIRAEIRTTKKQTTLENKNPEETLEMGLEAIETLKKHLASMKDK